MEIQPFSRKHSRPQSPQSFWSAPGIVASHADVLWFVGEEHVTSPKNICMGGYKDQDLRPDPI